VQTEYRVELGGVPTSMTRADRAWPVMRFWVVE
jgi:hypothetical protein